MENAENVEIIDKEGMFIYILLDKEDECVLLFYKL